MNPTPTMQFEQLSTRAFTAVAEAVGAHAGIKLTSAKQTMVEGRLRKRMYALGMSSLDEYVAHALSLQEQDHEMVHLIDAVTTNKTDFFREPMHFRYLEENAIPTLVQQHGRSHARLKIWSAACSTGAEAYTAAMVLQDLQNRRRDFQYGILGTDISTQVLLEAKTAIYPTPMIDPVPADKRNRYVMAAKDAARNEVRIVPELRRRVNFERLNLTDEVYPFDNDVDVIFCRNVLIYFEKPTQRAVIDRLVSHLRPGGYLFFGHSEAMAATDTEGLRQVSPTIYRAEPTKQSNGR